MKIPGKLLALGVFYSNVLGISAFFTQTPKGVAFKHHQSTTSSNANQSPRLSSSALSETVADLVRVEGNSLRTWAIDPRYDWAQVLLTTEGRPLHSNLELWYGPDYTPSKLQIYIEDGLVRPFNALIATPLASNTVAIYNTAQQEFPFTASVQGAANTAPQALSEMGTPTLVQGGGMVLSRPFDPHVESVQIQLKTEGRNLKAKIELLQGPNNRKQVLEFYSSDGKKRPFFAVIETPGAGNMVRIVNENTVEYPFLAWVEPFTIEAEDPPADIVVS